MDDLVKNLLYTSVGIVSLTADKFRDTIDGLVSEKKISSEEGKKIVDDFVENTSAKKSELEAQLEHITEKAMKKFSFTNHEKIEDLTARVENLEKKLEDMKATE